jgi:acetyl esterase/lipase
MTHRTIQLAVIAATALLALIAPTNAAASTASTKESNPAIVTTRGIVYALRPHIQLKMDVRRNTAAAPDAPIVILIHGGGWWYGTRADLMDIDPIGSSFANAGFVAISIDYRLACGSSSAPPRIRYGVNYNRPSVMCGAHIGDQVADVIEAIQYAKRSAASWGASPDRITLLGASAGGHLALLAAATAPADARVRAVANWSGPSSTDFITRQNPHRKPSIIGSFTNAVGCMWVASPACKARWFAASPYKRLNARSEKFAVLAVSGTRERQVPAATNYQFDTKLRHLGFPSRVIALPSSCHGAGCRRLFDGTPRGRMRTVEATTIAYLAAHS